MKVPKPYRIIGAYDSETTNIDIDGIPQAFPILHQLGLLDGTPLANITPETVEECTQVEYYRHAFELYERLDQMVNVSSEYVPVILCHNLAFDMYGLSGWLSRHNVRVLAKSARKPISFTILDDDNSPRLVIWDTLVFTQQSLERMGADCGYSKGSGEWDYTLTRCPQTPLTAAELDYAKRDILALLCWFAWWIRRNPDIEESKIGASVVTKTGVVRERRRVRFSKLKGDGMKRSVAHYWYARCKLETPKTDDELFTMLACTRGGFTFCASKSASVPFNLTDDRRVYGFDSTSQHPAQLVSHWYPVRFREMPPFVLEQAFELVGMTTLGDLLEHWDKPFSVAFNACFEFVNLRPRKGSLFERFGIYPLASARYKTDEQLKMYEENGDKAAYDAHLKSHYYIDSCANAKFAFGKIVSADAARIYMTELTAWEMHRCYEWDSVKALHGYETGRFAKPNDMDVISVMQFYKAKNAFKEEREIFKANGQIMTGSELESLGIPSAMVREMENGTASEGDVDATYMSLKADLNAIFGISCTNPYRRDTVLSSEGIEYVGEFGLCNAPKTPKVWYQFGQRIVGWSRIAQICIMELIEPYVETIINGDTDSIKFVAKHENEPDIKAALGKHARALDRAKRKVCARVRKAYPDMFDPLDGIGHYVQEFVTDRFCASWNKAYTTHEIGRDGKRHFNFTLAGVPTRRRENAHSCFIGVNGYADRLHALGWSYEDVCNLLLGYNVTLAYDVIRMNARKFPEWGACLFDKVTDYLGDTYTVSEPNALALYPMSKTINDTSVFDNRINMRYALSNNPEVNINPCIVTSSGVIELEGSN